MSASGDTRSSLAADALHARAVASGARARFVERAPVFVDASGSLVARAARRFTRRFVRLFARRFARPSDYVGQAALLGQVRGSESGRCTDRGSLAQARTRVAVRTSDASVRALPPRRRPPCQSARARMRIA